MVPVDCKAGIFNAVGCVGSGMGIKLVWSPMATVWSNMAGEANYKLCSASWAAKPFVGTMGLLKISAFVDTSYLIIGNGVIWL